MKNVLAVVFTLSMVPGVTAFIVSTTAARPGPAALPLGAPPKNIQGTVKADEEKVSFVAVEDGKSWDVMNPEVLKPHAVHPVEVSAHVYPDKSAIHVLTVKMVKKADK